MRCLCPDLRSLLPRARLLPLCHPQWEGCKGVGKGSPAAVIVGAASPGAYQPLTDLGKCSSGERAQGTPHSCAALAPVRVGWHRGTWGHGRPGAGAGASVGGPLAALSQHVPSGSRHRVCQLLQGVPEHLWRGRDPGPALRGGHPQRVCSAAGPAPAPPPAPPACPMRRGGCGRSLSTSQGSWSFSNCAEGCMAAS